MSFVLMAGLLLGMRHALDADHLAAVASLAGSRDTVPRLVRIGVCWALGHSLTLMIVGTAVLLSGSIIPTAFEVFFEGVAGLLLIVLGIGVLHRVLLEHLRVHAHDQSGRWQGRTYAAASPHQTPNHDRTTIYSRRALAVGAVHGLAGSAALVLLTLATIESIWTGIGYLALLALGTIVGMGLLSCALAVPIQLFAKRLTFQFNCVLLLVGGWSCFLGTAILHEALGSFVL